MNGLTPDVIESAINCFELQQRASPLVARRVLRLVVERLASIGFDDLSGLSIFSLNKFMVSEFQRSGLSRFQVLEGGGAGRAKPPIALLEGSDEWVRASVVTADGERRSALASRETIAAALAILPRLSELQAKEMSDG